MCYAWLLWRVFIINAKRGNHTVTIKTTIYSNCVCPSKQRAWAIKSEFSRLLEKPNQIKIKTINSSNAIWNWWQYKNKSQFRWTSPHFKCISSASSVMWKETCSSSWWHMTNKDLRSSQWKRIRVLLIASHTHVCVLHSIGVALKDQAEDEFWEFLSTEWDSSRRQYQSFFNCKWLRRYEHLSRWKWKILIILGRNRYHISWQRVMKTHLIHSNIRKVNINLNDFLIF